MYNVLKQGMEEATPSGARVLDNNTVCSVEFVVSRSKVFKVRTGIPRVKELFNTTVEFGKISPKASRDGEPQQWISLHAPSEKETTGAKDYILALSSPEMTMTVEDGQTFKTLSHDDHLDIERQSHAVVRQREGSLEICGDELSVVLAQSMIDAVFSPRDCIVIDNDNDELNSNNSSLRTARAYSSNLSSRAPNKDHTPPSASLLGAHGGPTLPHYPFHHHHHHQLTMVPMDTELSSTLHYPTPSSSSSALLPVPMPTLSTDTTPTSLRTPWLVYPGLAMTGGTTCLRPSTSQAIQPAIPSSGYLASQPAVPSSIQPSQPAVPSSKPTPANQPVSTIPSPQGRQQWSYLRNVGLSCNYSEDDVLTALAQFDMEDVIVPSHFLGMLREIKAARHGGGSVNENLPDRTMSAAHSAGVGKAGHSMSEHHVMDDFVIISDEEDNTPLQPLVPPKQVRSPVGSLAEGQSQVDLTSRSKAREEIRRPDEGQPDPMMGSGDATGLSKQKSGDSNLRYIVIDGSNVAMCHGDNKVFSARGLEICINFFKARGHPQILAFVSESCRYSTNPIYLKGRQKLEKLNQDGYVKFTPARRVNGRQISSYEDRFILNLALKEDAVVVSNDQFRDLCLENPKYLNIVENRLLQFVFVDDHFMPPDDPLGRKGPSLDRFLQKTGSISKVPTPAAQKLANLRTNRPGMFPRPTMMRDQGQKVFTQPQRSREKTETLFVQLVQIFPKQDQQVCVRTVLENHPGETDINRLTNFCINAIGL